MRSSMPGSRKQPTQTMAPRLHEFESRSRDWSKATWSTTDYPSYTPYRTCTARKERDTRRWRSNLHYYGCDDFLDKLTPSMLCICIYSTGELITKTCPRTARIVGIMLLFCTRKGVLRFRGLLLRNFCRRMGRTGNEG